MDRTPEDSVDTERFEKALDERVVAMVTEEDEEQHFRLPRSGKSPSKMSVGRCPTERKNLNKP